MVNTSMAKGSFIPAMLSKTILLIALLLPVAKVALATDTTFRSASPFPFGASINITLLRNNPTYRGVVAREYNSVTAENVMKMATIHPAVNTYSWSLADTLVNFAQQNNKRVHGHTLIWHQSLPGWVTGFAGDSAAWENMFKSHIQTVVSHYAGIVKSWDVVNEAFNDDGTLRNSIWQQHLGPNYIARAFQYAHESDPAALLFYNDYGHEYSSAKLRAIDSLVKTFLQTGVPVHGVGLQLHINKNTLNTGIANAIKIMTNTGLQIHLSELDISMNPENNPALTFTPALSQLQADKYNFITRLYKNIPAAQQYGITTWNVSDADTWITGNYNRPDWPLPFDTTYQKKQAYHAIIEGLFSKWNYDASGGQSIPGTYTDLGTNGTPISINFAGGAMTFDNDNSSVQTIGFPFFYNGSIYQQFILNTNGYVKLGADAPSSASLFYPTFNGNTNGIITAPDADLLYPYNHDLTGTPATEYRVYTTGQTGSRVCTIQYKAVADKLAPTQYANMNFQIKLYEGSNIIEFVYGPWTSSSNTPTLITGALGIKGSFANNSVNLAKGSATNWSGALSTANSIYYINGDYATAGPQFNTRNTALPDVGRTYRFTPLNQFVLPVTLLRFYAVNRNTGALITWATENENNCKNFEVQRSVNGYDFIPAGTVMASGRGSTTVNLYSFMDENLYNAGGTWYRLKQNDADGRFQYSGTVVVYNNKVKKLSLTATNPFKDNLQLNAVSATSGRMMLYIVNTEGVVVRKKAINVSAGTIHLSWKETNTLSKGLYILKVVKETEVCLLQLIKE